MNRLKFRIWDKQYKKYGPSDSRFRNENFQAFKFKADGLGGWFEITNHEWAEIEMFAGFQDVSGEDIYEGDILATQPMSYAKFVFSFSEIENWTNTESPKSFYGSLKIIGNIRENKDLLT